MSSEARLVAVMTSPWQPRHRNAGWVTVKNQDVPIATTSRDPDAGQVQQQATEVTTGVKLSRTELNVLKTMIYVVVCFMICWTPNDISAVLHNTEVSTQK